jgi:hypothetical protein
MGPQPGSQIIGDQVQAILARWQPPTEDSFRERSSRADIGKAKRILKRAGKGKPPLVGDEVR